MMLKPIILLLCCLIPDIASRGHTKNCRHCNNVQSPDECNVIQVCHEEWCGAEVHELNGNYSLSYRCIPHHDCEAAAILGKRAGHHDKGTLVCRQCCDVSGCEKNLCQGFVDTATDAPPAATTTLDPLIVNPDCRDYESSTFQCAELEKYNFCTDATSVAYAIAHEKCAKHCGFCSPYHVSTVVPDTPAPTTMGVATDAQTTVMVSSDPDSTVQTTTMDGPVDVTINVETTTAMQTLCLDVEDTNFSCADWLKFGFCDPNSGVGYEVARLRCQKTCGFCTP